MVSSPSKVPQEYVTLESNTLLDKKFYWGHLDEESALKKLKKEEIPFLPFPKLFSESESEVTTRPELGPNHLPSVSLYTLMNTFDTLNAVELSANGKLIAGGFSDSLVRIWDVEKMFSKSKDDDHIPKSTKKLIGHSGSVYGLSFSSDSKWLLSSGDDKSKQIFLSL